MSFIRPEAAAGLARWREALIGGAIALWGAYWAFTALGVFKWLGVVLILAGLALGWSAVQRARFRAGSGGLGVVEIDERQITYLAPVGGGLVSLDTLTHVAIVANAIGAPVWRFDTGGERISIPAAAQGAETLFDALTALPGAHIETAIRTLKAPSKTPVTIWSRGPRAIDTPRAIPHS